MRHCVLLVLFLHCLGGLGLPLFELSSRADDALRMALDEINTRYARHNLYRVSKASVTRVVPLGTNMYDMMLKFGIRETECRKGSGIDAQGCAYRRGFFVLEAGCHIRTRLSERHTNIVSLKCNPAQSSSSESSEEVWSGWHYDPNRLGRKGCGDVAMWHGEFPVENSQCSCSNHLYFDVRFEQEHWEFSMPHHYPVPSTATPSSDAPPPIHPGRRGDISVREDYLSNYLE